MSAVARGSVLNLLGSAVAATAGLLLTVVITRSMPKSSAGVFFTLTSLFLLAEMITCLGTGTGLVYFTARLRSLGRSDQIRAFQRVALTPVVALSVVAAVALAVGAPALARLAGGGAGTRVAVVVLAVLLPAAVLSDTLLAGTRGHATMLPTVALERITRQLLQLGLVVAAVASGSLVLLVGAWAVPWLLTAVLAAWWLTRLGRALPRRTGAAVDRSAGREFWRFTGPRAVTSVVQLALQRLDIVLITVLIGPAQAAVYTAATRFLVVGQQISTSVANAAQPRLAELMAVDDRASAKSVYQSATAWIVVLSWPLYLLCGVFADVVLRVFGRGYAAGASVVLVLSGAMLLATACGMVDMVLNMAGRTSWTLGNAVFSLAVMVGVDLTLIPRIGILGAGIGWAAALVANNALPLSQLFTTLRLHPFGRATAAAVAVAAVCFGVVPGLARLLVPGTTTAALVALLVGAVLYAAACLRWRRPLGLPALSALRPRRSRFVPAASPAPSPGGLA